MAAEDWYETAAKLHKEWAKTYHKEGDLERYTNIHKLVIGKDVKLKPGKVLFPGYPSQLSMNVNVNKGAMAEGMMVFADYMAMAKTEEKLEALLLKDK